MYEPSCVVATYGNQWAAALPLTFNHSLTHARPPSLNCRTEIRATRLILRDIEGASMHLAVPSIATRWLQCYPARCVSVLAASEHGCVVLPLRLQVLQTLYSCQPFRERLLQYAAGPATREAEETILSCLADLFLQVLKLTSSAQLYSPFRRFTRPVLDLSC